MQWRSLAATACAALHPSTYVPWRAERFGRLICVRTPASLRRRLAGVGGHFVLLRPGDEALWREAAVALPGAPPGPLARAHRLLVRGSGHGCVGGWGVGGGVLVVVGRGGIAERAPALDAVEVGVVGVEVDPHRGLLQLRVLAEQAAVAVHERLQNLTKPKQSQNSEHVSYAPCQENKPLHCLATANFADNIEISTSSEL